MDISHFFLAGISYRKADTQTRSRFALTEEKYKALLQTGSSGLHRDEFFVLSTCNRTEIYGIADHAGQLAEILCRETDGSSADFMAQAYVLRGVRAVEHLFRVASGLDSQILGDYEIVGQLKKAVRMARLAGRISTFTDRLISVAFQCSKSVKARTSLSGGTVSVSFAAVQYIKDQIPDFRHKKITLVGTGKFGRNTCKNLIDYLGIHRLTLVNRTDEKAFQLARTFHLDAVAYSDINPVLASSDVILVTTESKEAIVKKYQLEGHGPKWVIDLSIPCNVESSVRDLPGITLIDIDELSRIKDETLAQRLADAPVAEEIVQEFVFAFQHWVGSRKHAPVLQAVKVKLMEIQDSSVFLQNDEPAPALDEPDQKIRQVIRTMAVRMRNQNLQGCHYIQAINEFIS